MSSRLERSPFRCKIAALNFANARERRQVKFHDILYAMTLALHSGPRTGEDARGCAAF